MARPTQEEVAEHLSRFAAELTAIAADASEPGSTLSEDLSEIAWDAAAAAKRQLREAKPAARETPEELFQLSDRAQDVRTGLDDPASEAGQRLQSAIERLRAFIITHRVLSLKNGHVWAE